MREKIAILAVALAVMVVASMPADSMAKKKTEPAQAPDWAMLDVNKWDETVYKLVPPPTEDGNAMDYMIEAIHNAWDTSGENSKMPYEWWGDLKKETYESDEPEKKAIIAQAIKIPEIDILIKAGKQKNYHWFGTYYTPSPKPSEAIYIHKQPYYIDVFKLSQLLTIRAFDKLAKGDKAGAREDMFTAIRVGHIMQNDVVLIGCLIGVNIELKAAKNMPDFYREAGDEAKAKEWEELQPLFAQHKDAHRAYSRYIDSATLEQITEVVKNESLPRALRTDILSRAVGNEIMSHPLRFALCGPSKELKKFLLTDYFEDPEMRIYHLKVIEDVFVFLADIKYKNKSK